MNEITLPPSPSWYLNNIFDCCYDGTIAWGSRNNIIIGVRASVETKSIGSFSYKIIKKVSKEKVISVSFAPRNIESTDRLLAFTSDDNVQVWNLSTLSMLYKYSFADGKVAIAAEWSQSQPFRLFCLSNKGCVISWDLRSDSISSIFLDKAMSCLSSCPYNSQLIAVGSKTGLVYVIQFRGKPAVLHKLREHDTEIVSLSWCPSPVNVLCGDDSANVSLLASGAKDRSVFVWRTAEHGRCPMEIRLPANPLDSRQHRSKLAVKNSIVVNWVRPTLLLTSSLWGELIAWDFSALPPNGKPTCKLIHASHIRSLFCIAQHPSDHRKLLQFSADTIDDDGSETDKQNAISRTEEEDRIEVWTLAQDRQVVCCTIDQDDITIEYNITTQNGMIFCVTPCPFETSRIAFGVGSTGLYLWNLSSANYTTYDIVALWQKIKGKIRALAWHPKKENLLAYATDEGHIGVFDVGNVSKPPMCYKHYHGNVIYSLGWGPKPSVISHTSNTSFCLYSCAEGQLVFYDPEKPNEDPTIVLKNDCTEFSWRSDFSCLAVGFQDGSISFFDHNLNLRGRANIVASRKGMVYCLVWHPESTAADVTVSPFRNYLAVCFANTEIHIYDLSDYMERCNNQLEKSTPVDVNGDAQPYWRIDKEVATLNGHQRDVVCLAWSPYFSGHLVSGSYDKTVQVWDVETKELMATYTGHGGPVLCCMWSPLHPDFVITGSADNTLQIWNFRNHGLDGKELGSPEKSSKRKKKLKGRSLLQPDGIDTNSGNNQNRDNDEYRVPQDDGNDSCGGSDDQNNERTRDGKENRENTGEEMSKSKKEKKRKACSYFMNVDQMTNDEKLLDAIAHIVATMSDHQNNVIPDHSVITFPLLNNYDEQDFRHLISVERCAHSDAGRFDIAAEMSVLSNDLKQELDEATKQKRLNDYLVSLSPSLSTKVWKETCQAYASQLISEGNSLKAASYLLSIHETYKAIQTLEEVGRYKETYAIARCKLCPDDPTLKMILKNWAGHCIKSGQILKAAYIYTELGDFSKASEYLARRPNTKTLRIRAELALLSGDESLAATLAGQAVASLALSETGYETARTLATKFPRLKFRELQLCVIDALRKRVIGLQKVEPDTFREWLDGNSEYGLLETLKTCYISMGQHESYYPDLHKYVSSEDSLHNENTLWLMVTNEITRAVIADQKEEEWKHILNALDFISRFEVLHRRSFEDGNRSSCLVQVIRILDAACPNQPNSMFVKTDSCLSTSLRAYLCLGLLTWLLESVRHEDGIDQMYYKFLPLVQELLADALNKPVLRYYCAKIEITKLKARLSSLLSKPVEEQDQSKQSDVGGDDKKEEVTSLAESLERLRDEKKRFIEEHIAAPNPMIIYGKASQLLSKLPETENFREEFAQALQQVWAEATSVDLEQIN